MNITTIIPHGDGTGIEITYGDDGTIIDRQPVTGLTVPPPEPAAPSLDEQVAELQAIVAEQATVIAALTEGY